MMESDGLGSAGEGKACRCCIFMEISQTFKDSIYLITGEKLIQVIGEL